MIDNELDLGYEHLDLIDLDKYLDCELADAFSNDGTETIQEYEDKFRIDHI
mgnify:FL=1